jgi:ribosomal protein S18 acetylase RimI-like enzyme
MMTHESIAAIGSSIARIAEAHIDRAFRKMLRGPMVAHERGFVRLLSGEPHPFGNLAVITDASDRPSLAAAIEPLRTCSAPSAVLFIGPAGTDVVDQLNADGFELHDAMPAMAVDIDALRTTALPGGYSFHSVGQGAESDQWAQAFAAGYEVPRGLASLFAPNAVGATTAADAPLQCFAIRNERGETVCTSTLYLDDGVAGIYCVATIPSERGKGLGAHATAEPLRLVRELGYRVGVLQSSQAGHSVYRKLGFTDVGEVPLLMRMPKIATP